MVTIAPNVEVQTDSVHACTPWLARLLWLFSYCRCVTVQRQLQRVVISTRWLWFWQRVRVVPFDRISRIIYRAQRLPNLAFWRYLSLADSDPSESAFFLISIGLKSDSHGYSDELSLFTVWEDLPRERDWLDKLAGVPDNDGLIGDESPRAIVEILHEYLRVPISSH